MVKRKYWPFDYYKWRRSYALDCELYCESIQVQKLNWHDAYYCCRDDIEYIDKHGERFDNRYRFLGICRFLALALATSLLVITIFVLCWGLKMTARQILVVAGVSLGLILIEFVLRTLYYRGVEFDLVYADNRVCSLASVWPQIVEIVSYDLMNGYDELPLEPEKTLDAEKFKDGAMNAVKEEKPNIPVFFDEDEHEDEADDDGKKMLDALFAHLNDPVVSDDEKPDDNDVLEPISVAENIVIEPEELEKLGESGKPEERQEPIEEPAERIARLTDKIDALNKRLQEGS